jgi:hypothetical protein
MTTRTFIASAFVFLALNGTTHAQECTTPTQREASVRKLYQEIDGFLSIVEEVPEGVARQFREVDTRNERAFRTAISHPLWQAHNVRDAADKIKKSLAGS